MSTPHPRNISTGLHLKVEQTRQDEQTFDSERPRVIAGTSAASPDESLRTAGKPHVLPLGRATPAGG